MPQRIQAPDGSLIDFPDDMDDNAIGQVMRKKYPPISPKWVRNTSPQPVQGLTAKVESPQPIEDSLLGSMIPQWAVPALEGAKKYLIDPLENLARIGGEQGGQFASAYAQQIQKKGMYENPLFMPMSDAERTQALAQARETHPMAYATGNVTGSTLADPRNWPLMASGEARPLLQRAISSGFAAQMGKGAIDSATDLYQNWDKYTPGQRLEKATGGGLSALFAAMSGSHAVGKMDVPVKPNADLQSPRTPLGEGDIDYETRGASGPAPKDSVETQIANLQMRHQSAPVLSQTRADIREQIDSVRQTAGLPPQPTEQLLGDANPSTRNVADLMASSDMKETQITPEQAQANREAFLGMTKKYSGENALGPAKDYAQPDALKPEAIKSENDWFQQAKQELGPDAGVSAWAERAQELKELSKQPPAPSVANAEAGILSLRKIPPKPLSDSPLGQLEFEMRKKIADAPIGQGFDPKTAIENSVKKAKDDITSGFERLTANAAQLHEYWRNPVPNTDFDKLVAKWSGNIQRSNVDTDRFVSTLNDKVPDMRDQAAISRWVMAKGDVNELKAQAASIGDPKLKDIYNRAANLTPDQQKIGQMARDYFDIRLQQLQDSGRLVAGRENYLPLMFEKSEKVTKFFSDTFNADMRTRPNFLKERFYEDAFHAESNGLQLRKQGAIGYLVGAYDKSFNGAMNAHNFLDSLRGKEDNFGNVITPAALAKDGRPILGHVDGSGSKIESPNGDTTFIRSYGSKPESMEGYRTSQNPLFKGWKWVGKDGLGGDVMYQGQLMVHPDYIDRMKNFFEPSPLRKYAIGRGVLKASSVAKRSILSLIPVPFHQVQTGTHAVFHGVNPLAPDKIDLTNPSVNRLLDGGMILGDDTGLDYISEGSAGIPAYQHYLFGPNGYIARLKVATGLKALENNTQRYSGKLSPDDIAMLSAQQMNNAFGGLNYKLLGRSPLMQDIFRLMVLAPDFTEARARFVGEALKPYGMEQRKALMRGALGMYVTARIANKVFDDDYHFDKPFSLVLGGKEYMMRSLPGDIEHLLDDPNSFLYHRLNPVMARTPFELMSKRDQFGRKRSAGEAIMDTVRAIAPIPLQVPIEKATEKGFREQDYTDSILGAVGVNVKKYRSPAENYAHQLVMDAMPQNAQSKGITYMANKIQENKFSADEARDLLSSGRMQPKDLLSAFKMAKSPALVRDFENPSISPMDAARIYQLANDKERGILAKPLARKLRNMKDLAPADRAKVMSIMKDLD